MKIIGLLISIFVFLFILFIDFNYLLKNEKLKISIKNFKNLKIKYIFLNFFIILFFNLYLIYLFFDNDILYIINLLCFLCIYICAITDIFCKNIFLNVFFIFTVPIIFFNIYGNYTIISIFGCIYGMFLYTFIYVISKCFYKKESFGIGDIYILSLIGLSTDWNTVLYIGLFSFLFAGIFYFVKLILKEKNLEKLKNEEIAFVPFILISYLFFIYF